MKISIMEPPRRRRRHVARTAGWHCLMLFASGSLVMSSLWCTITSYNADLDSRIIREGVFSSNANMQNATNKQRFKNRSPDEADNGIQRRDAFRMVLDLLPANQTPDFDGIRVVSLKNASEFSRVILDPLNNGYNHERDTHLLTMDRADLGRKTEVGDEWISREELANRTLFNFHRPKCRQNNWKHTMFPNCNTVHEISPEMNDRKLLGYVFFVEILKRLH